MNRGRFTDPQRDVLLEPIRPHRVSKDRNGLSHMEGYEVEAHLSRLFGFEGWDREIMELWLIADDLEDYKKRDGSMAKGWTVTYGCRLRLTIYDMMGDVAKQVDGCATGSANHLPLRGDAHDFAMKNADTYALKRCAKALGDQFGLSLYNKGSMAPLVQKVVPYLGPVERSIIHADDPSA